MRERGGGERERETERRGREREEREELSHRNWRCRCKSLENSITNMDRSAMVGIKPTRVDCAGHKESPVDCKAEHGRFAEKMAVFRSLGSSG